MRKIPGIALLTLLSVCSSAHANAFLPSGHIALSSTRMALPSANKLQSLEELADKLFMANGPVLNSVKDISVDDMKTHVKDSTDRWQHALSQATGLNTADRKKAVAYGKVKILICKANFVYFNLAAQKQAAALAPWLLEGQDLNDPALATMDRGMSLSFVNCFLKAKEQVANTVPAGNNAEPFNKYKYLLASNCPDALKQQILDFRISPQFRSDYCSPELSALIPDIHQGIKDPSIVHYFDSLLVRYHKLDKGQPAPDFTLMDCNGKTVKLSDYRGKKVVIEVWSTNCIPCLKAMPIYDSMVAANIASNNFTNTVFLKFAADRLANLSELTGGWRDAILSRHLDPATNLIAVGVAQYNAMMDAYAIGALGHYYVIDKDGKIISLNHVNPLDPELFKDIKE